METSHADTDSENYDIALSSNGSGGSGIVFHQVVMQKILEKCHQHLFLSQQKMWGNIHQ